MFLDDLRLQVNLSFGIDEQVFQTKFAKIGVGKELYFYFYIFHKIILFYYYSFTGSCF